MPKTADKLSDPISRQALIDAIQDSLNRHCQPWTPTPREKRAARPKIKRNPCHEPSEWKHIGNQINAAFIPARSDFVKLPKPRASLDRFNHTALCAVKRGRVLAEKSLRSVLRPIKTR